MVEQQRLPVNWRSLEVNYVCWWSDVGSWRTKYHNFLFLSSIKSYKQSHESLVLAVGVVKFGVAVWR